MDVKLLDMRMAGSSSENVEISIKEDFFLYRVIFLIIGILLLSMASSLTEALVSGIIVSSTLRRVFRVKFLRQLYKKSLKLVKSIHLPSDAPDLSPFGGSPDKYGFRSSDDSKIIRTRPKRFTLASSSSPMQDFSRKQSRELADLDVYPSAVRRTRERRKFSKAVQELVLSPDFSQWAAANADRITVTPQSIGTSAKQQRKWFFWF